MEILTLQLGNFANHIGSHYWNFQDEMSNQDDPEAEDSGPELDWDRVYSSVERGLSGGVEYRPRLVVVDLQGAMGSVRPRTYAKKEEDNQDASQLLASQLWGGPVLDIHSEPVKRHAYLNDLDKEDEEREKSDDEQDWDYKGDNAADEEDSETPAVKCSGSSYDFANTAQYWTDFSKVELPKSCVHELTGRHHGVDPFLLYWEGLSIKGRDEEEDLLDVIRRQVEMCDNLDVVQAMVDVHDGFGGIGDVVLQWMHDESPKVGVMVVGAVPAIPEKAEMEVSENMERSSRLDGMQGIPPEQWVESVNAGNPAPTVAEWEPSVVYWLGAAFATSSSIDAGASVVVPVSVPLWSAQTNHLNLRFGSRYETGGLIAAAFETATFPWRISGNSRPSSYVSQLAPRSRPVCGLQVALPLPAWNHCPAQGNGLGAGYSASPVQVASRPSFYDLTGMKALSSNEHTSLILRGVSDPGEQLLAMCRGFHPRARHLSYAAPQVLPLPVPFPQFFSPTVSSKGSVASGAAPRMNGLDVETCPVGSLVHAAEGAEKCQPLHQMKNALIASQRLARLGTLQAQYGVDRDEIKEVLEIIQSHIEASAADSSGQDDDGDDAMSD
eukprot:gnl/MRDRNA2_/MRDRNA2_72680_c0_seq1.p1 gnl/MRDRNA2_/MRDRNA2_72680_c0~~gnl/MRDRNA2_/MRDRNA2_72680_c0_seq1.p1  ORF type:complete len:609 (+),score=132.64 gnl/MRDRNA2_/MRDRNA2_72680_c0_seq1:100-1926(+)